MWDVKSESHIAYPIVEFPDFRVMSHRKALNI